MDAHFQLPGGVRQLFRSSQERIIRRKHCADDSEAVKALPLEQKMDAKQQQDLLKRLRWISVGLQYDWTKKEYFDQAEVIPTFVIDLCEKLSRMAGLGEFKAEAGIVNFYQPGDSLTSHVRENVFDSISRYFNI